MRSSLFRIFASYAIGDLLERGDQDGLRKYSRYVFEEFESYIQTRRKYDQEEQRWPTSEFGVDGTRLGARTVSTGSLEFRF